MIINNFHKTAPRFVMNRGVFVCMYYTLNL